MFSTRGVASVVAAVVPFRRRRPCEAIVRVAAADILIRPAWQLRSVSRLCPSANVFVALTHRDQWAMALIWPQPACSRVGSESASWAPTPSRGILDRRVLIVGGLIISDYFGQRRRTFGGSVCSARTGIRFSTWALYDRISSSCRR